MSKSVAPPSKDAPRRLRSPENWPRSLNLAELGLEPAVDWAGGLGEAWEPGEAGAARQLRRFLKEALAEYPANRDRPGVVGTSRLSPHLHFGEIGTGEVWRAVLGMMNDNRGACEAYLRQIGWREFAYHLLYHHPESPREALRREFAAFPWWAHPAHFTASKRGQTGYPLVDADLANNTLAWQWIAGCGADAAPYFRIFNPALQAAEFDAGGEYVRRWVPEPANAYPLPIVDHGEARARALAGLERIRKK